MKLASIQSVIGSAAILLISAPTTQAYGPSHAAHDRVHNERRLSHSHAHHQSDPAGLFERTSPLVRRNSEGKAICELPSHSDLVRVPGKLNGGFAMAPDRECVEGSYCPIACRAGMLMAQWEPGSVVAYPESMNGGLLCKSNGQAEKPFEDQPYCVDGVGTVAAVNECGKALSFCQTVFPGDEGMYIKTIVDQSATLAVPDPSYWQSTGAHYYINPPGVQEEGCVWGDSSKNIGNWATYVAGANQDAKGQTFVTLGYNPIWEGSSLSSTTPNYAVKIECPGGGCNGTPCGIDPSKNAVGTVSSDMKSTGAGGSQFCVVTVPKGSKANIVVYLIGEQAEDDSEDEKHSEVKAEESEPKTSSKPSPTPTPTPTPTPEPEPESSQPPSSSAPETSSIEPETSSSAAETSTYEEPVPSIRPAIFHENKTESVSEAESTILSTTAVFSSPTTDTEEAAATSSDENHGIRQGATVVGSLIVALAAAAILT